ncbi:unnamed protein product, partial [marine sediment metagenome]
MNVYLTVNPAALLVIFSILIAFNGLLVLLIHNWRTLVKINYVRDHEDLFQVERTIFQNLYVLFILFSSHLLIPVIYSYITLLTEFKIENYDTFVSTIVYLFILWGNGVIIKS